MHKGAHESLGIEDLGLKLSNPRRPSLTYPDAVKSYDQDKELQQGNSNGQASQDNCTPDVLNLNTGYGTIGRTI